MRADLRGAYPENANLHSTFLNGANLQGAYLGYGARKTRFSSARLTRAIWENGKRCLNEFTGECIQ